MMFVHLVDEQEKIPVTPILDGVSCSQRFRATSLSDAREEANDAQRCQNHERRVS